MKLRPYQNQVIKDVYKFYRMGLRSVMLYAATASGKTVMAAKMIADAVAKGRRALFLVHRTKLAFQTVDTLKRAYGIDAGIIWADYPKNPDAPVQIAMIQTLQNRELPKDIGLVIIDESHTTTYYAIVQKVFNTYSGGILPLSPCYFLGLSGSPWRAKSSTEGFCQFFQAIARAPSPDQLIQMGHLVTARHFGWNGLADFSELEMSKEGDYTQASMAKVCTTELNTEIVKRFKEHCPNRKPIAFCASVEQAKDLTRQFSEAGIVAETVVGEVTEDNRDRIYQRYSDNRTQLLSSVGVLCEGFDETSCDAVILARPIGSLPLLIQTCGRALRLHNGKVDALLLDFCENFKRKGHVTKNHPISLCPRNKPVFTPTKECPECHASIPTFARICPECGYEFEGDAEEDNGMKHQDAEFGELLSEDQHKQCTYLRSQLKSAFNQNRDIGRVTWLFHRKYNFIPPQHWFKDAIFRRGKLVHENQKTTDIEAFKKYLKKCRPTAPKAWFGDMLRNEFGYAFYDLSPLQWWKILDVDLTATWEDVKLAYMIKISSASSEDAPLLNFCLEEAREFCAVMNVKTA